MWTALSRILGHVRIISATLALASSVVRGTSSIITQPYLLVKSGSGWAGVPPGIVMGFGLFLAEVGTGFCFALGQLSGGVAVAIRSIVAVDTPVTQSLPAKPQTFAHALVGSTIVISEAFRASATSWVRLPARGWRQSGASGALKGTAEAASALLLPVSSVFDVLSRITFGIQAEIDMLAYGHHSVDGPRRNHAQVRVVCMPGMPQFRDLGTAMWGEGGGVSRIPARPIPHAAADLGTHFRPMRTDRWSRNAFMPCASTGCRY
jgi:hypothetical protein